MWTSQGKILTNPKVINPGIERISFPMRQIIQFDLLNNAKDSLRQAVELLAIKLIGSDHARLKHSIMALSHGIELLLKERLRRINPDRKSVV